MSGRQCGRRRASCPKAQRPPRRQPGPVRSFPPNTDTVPVQLPPRIAPRLSAVGGSAGLAGVLAYSAHGISLSVLGIQLSAANPAI